MSIVIPALNYSKFWRENWRSKVTYSPGQCPRHDIWRKGEKQAHTKLLEYCGVIWAWVQIKPTYAVLYSTTCVANFVMSDDTVPSGRKIWPTPREASQNPLATCYHDETIWSHLCGSLRLRPYWYAQCELQKSQSQSQSQRG